MTSMAGEGFMLTEKTMEQTEEKTTTKAAEKKKNNLRSTTNCVTERSRKRKDAGEEGSLRGQLRSVNK